jgi:hypothetical protein
VKEETIMKKMMKAVGRFMYGNWYGAAVVFVAVASRFRVPL